MGWGPYQGQGEARQRLTAYADAVFGRPIGVLWTADGQTAWLRPPPFDGAGDGVALMVRCEPAPPPPPLALPTMQKVEAALMGAWRTTSMLTPLPSPETVDFLNRHVVKPADDFLGRHPVLKDGIIVTADVVGVIAGVVAGFALFTVGGTVAVVAGLLATIVAGAACLVLLYEDGRHLWYTARGDKAGALRLEKQADYRWVQAIAPWFTLPDLIAGGRSVVRELAEAGERTTAVLSRTRTLEVRSTRATTEARQVLADPEQDWRQIKAARDEAARRANDYRRMHALAQRESANLMARRNAVVATVGGAYAVRQYVHEPPVLTERAIDKLKEKTHEAAADVYSRAEKALGAAAGSACRPGSVGHLLTPATPHKSAGVNLNMSVMVTHRGGKGR